MPDTVAYQLPYKPSVPFTEDDLNLELAVHLRPNCLNLFLNATHLYDPIIPADLNLTKVTSLNDLTPSGDFLLCGNFAQRNRRLYQIDKILARFPNAR